ncbi:nodulation protein NodN [Marinicauda salina]|jgi:acyl dehydratase|uniref:Nodulation protein NodN n=1 Tax=Marinicauda salina TaxID=2135793 RepID=A0A2U2BSV0_9PROT|nr:MaoC family dehydratase [Marinicauda salina]PWE17078.1 nodulation protein NodN [Marinicauda salina]
MSLVAAYADRIGQTNVSDWLRVDQERVNAFADATLDHQFIHVDPERAARETPWGGPIAHGFLTLSLMSHFAAQALPPFPDGAIGVNYGFEKVRFLTPVPVGARIRGKFTLARAEERRAGQVQIQQDCVVEIEDSESPALIAQWLSLVVAG